MTHTHSNRKLNMKFQLVIELFNSYMYIVLMYTPHFYYNNNREVRLWCVVYICGGAFFHKLLIGRKYHVRWRVVNFCATIF